MIKISLLNKIMLAFVIASFFSAIVFIYAAINGLSAIIIRNESNKELNISLFVVGKYIDKYKILGQNKKIALFENRDSEGSVQIECSNSGSSEKSVRQFGYVAAQQVAIFEIHLNGCEDKGNYRVIYMF